MKNRFREVVAKFIGQEPVSLKLPPEPVVMDRKVSESTWIPTQADWSELLPRTKYDYRNVVGDGLGSSVLMSPIKWIQRTFPEAPLQVTRKDGDQVEALPDHPLSILLDRPNRFYAGSDLWKATIYSWCVDGNAYWRKVRNQATGQVEELWYTPHWMIEPKWNRGTDEFITWYDYRPMGTGKPLRLAAEDVVHFRNGIDPRNTRKGMSLIHSEMREIFGDDEAANFQAALLRNMGVPGIVFSPDTSGSGRPPAIDVESVKAYLKQQFTRDKRGEPIVHGIPVKTHQFGFNPQQMDLSALRNQAEERVCAALGVRAAVVGFGAGLQVTKVGATMKEEVQLSWTGCVIPLQKGFASGIQHSLLPDFEPKPGFFSVHFDMSHVEALQANRTEEAARASQLFQGGVITRSEAREMTGLPWSELDDVYRLPLGVIEYVGTAPERATLSLAASEEPKAIKQASDIEERIIATSIEGVQTSSQRELMDKLGRDMVGLAKDFERDVNAFFAEMGTRIADSAIDILEQKQSDLNEVTADQIMSKVDIEELSKELSDIGSVHYLSIATATYETIGENIGRALDFTDERQRKVLLEGGRRLGVVMKEDSVRKRLFRELADGRSLGEGPVELARRIRKTVPAGTWTNPEVRSKMIARTETMHAQRISTIHAYQDAKDVEQVMIFDNTTGYGDDECTRLNGKIVPIDEAWLLIGEEHPNGTRAFAPVIE